MALQFENISPDKKPLRGIVKTERIKSTISTTQMEVEGGAIVLMVDNEEKTYEKLETPIKFQTILDIDKNTPHLIADFLPPLHEQYINKESRTIRPYVAVGDLVEVLPKFRTEDVPLTMKVEKVYFKSLNNMTVIIAKTNYDIYLANHLIKI